MQQKLILTGLEARSRSRCRTVLPMKALEERPFLASGIWWPWDFIGLWL